MADDHPSVFLYDAHQRPVGSRGILAYPVLGSVAAGIPVGVFNRWPRTLTKGKEFAARLVGRGPSAGLDEWRQPVKVEVTRMTDAAPATNLVMVTLSGVRDSVMSELPSLPRVTIETEMAALAGGVPLGATNAMVKLSGGVFDPLVQPQPPPVLTSSELASAVQATATPTFAVTSGDGGVVAFSICRMFHWD